MQIPAPFRLHEVTVSPEWTDYNHHLTESAYLLIMGESSDAFFRFFGVDDAYRLGGHSLYTVETHLRNLREAREGERLGLTIQVLGTDVKRLHIVHEMHRAAVQVFGGIGLMSRFPAERWWRDARVERIWDGTSEIQRHIIARSLLRPYGA